MSRVYYRGEHDRNFIKMFDKLCYGHSRWNVWCDFIALSAYTISNTVDRQHYEEREAAYLRTSRNYKPEELDLIAAMFSEIIMSLEENQNQDCLGDLYMRLELYNSHNGQYFTPYNVCQLMSDITIGTIEQEVEKNGWVACEDPCVGGGAMLIAHANTCLKHKVNYQLHVLYVGQDIDPVVAMMAYIQLSLLGCAGYICIGNSLTEPLTGHCLFPPMERDVFITPMFYSYAWEGRRQIALLKHLIGNEMPIQDNEEAESEDIDEQDGEAFTISSILHVEPVTICEQMSLFL